jgi:hypothetical protein
MLSAPAIGGGGAIVSLHLRPTHLQRRRLADHAARVAFVGAAREANIFIETTPADTDWKADTLAQEQAEAKDLKRIINYIRRAVSQIYTIQNIIYFAILIKIIKILCVK